MVTLRDFVDGKADLPNASFGQKVDKGEMKKPDVEKSDWKQRKSKEENEK